MKATKRFIAGLTVVILATLPASSETIQLQQSGGIYVLPVRINDAVTIPFILDSGAADVSIPVDVFLTLFRAGTISQSDFVGTGTYTLADGSTTSSKRYVLHKMVVGNHVINNVVANVASVQGDPLLGQSFLSKLLGWSIDNAQHALVLNEPAPATVAGVGIPVRPAPPAPVPGAAQNPFGAFGQWSSTAHPGAGGLIRFADVTVSADGALAGRVVFTGSPCAVAALFSGRVYGETAVLSMYVGQCGLTQVTLQRSGLGWSGTYRSQNPDSGVVQIVPP
jgi:hypothetical protein